MSSSLELLLLKNVKTIGSAPRSTTAKAGQACVLDGSPVCSCDSVPSAGSGENLIKDAATSSKVTDKSLVITE